MSVSEVFSNRETVKSCIAESWERMSSRSTTFEMAQNITKTLALCALYCPEDMRDLVDSAMINATMRMPFMPAQGATQ